MVVCHVCTLYHTGTRNRKRLSRSDRASHAVVQSSDFLGTTTWTAKKGGMRVLYARCGSLVTPLRVPRQGPSAMHGTGHREIVHALMHALLCTLSVRVHSRPCMLPACSPSSHSSPCMLAIKSSYELAAAASGAFAAADAPLPLLRATLEAWLPYLAVSSRTIGVLATAAASAHVPLPWPPPVGARV